MKNEPIQLRSMEEAIAYAKSQGLKNLFEQPVEIKGFGSYWKFLDRGVVPGMLHLVHLETGVQVPLCKMRGPRP